MPCKYNYFRIDLLSVLKYIIIKFRYINLVKNGKFTTFQVTILSALKLFFIIDHTLS